VTKINQSERLARRLVDTYRVCPLSAGSIIAADAIEAPSPSEAAAIGARIVSSSPWHSLLADRVEVWQGANLQHSARYRPAQPPEAQTQVMRGVVDAMQPGEAEVPLC
jgi:hypothetical protein